MKAIATLVSLMVMTTVNAAVKVPASCNSITKSLRSSFKCKSTDRPFIYLTLGFASKPNRAVPNLKGFILMANKSRWQIVDQLTIPNSQRSNFFNKSFSMDLIARLDSRLGYTLVKKEEGQAVISDKLNGTSEKLTCSVR